jgi:hypothetical protein
MPQLERWDNLPEGVRQHLIERMRDREISVSDLNQLRLWVETRPEVPGATGTRISALSKSAAADRTQRRSYSEGKSPRAKPSDHRALGDYSPLVAYRLLI